MYPAGKLDIEKKGRKYTQLDILPYYYIRWVRVCTVYVPYFLSSINMLLFIETFPLAATRVGEPEPVGFGSLEPERLEKKTRSWSRLEKKSGAGAGAAKKIAGSSAL